MRMRTDKLITIIFSVILGIIGLFTLYILGSSFLYDSGVMGGGEGYESMESLLEEDSNVTKDTAEVSEKDLASASQPLPSENEVVPSQDTGSEETIKFEDVPEEPQNRNVQEFKRNPATVSRNSEVTPASTSVRTSASSGSGISRKARYEELKKKFNYGTDASGAGWFVHEAWDSPSISHNTLICYISEKGDMYLASHYYGDNSIGHTQIQVMVNGREYVTQQVSINSPDFVDGKDGNNIWETVHYRKSGEKTIIDQIVRNVQMPVSVTLKGDQDVRFVLGIAEKTAMKECSELADLLSYL